MQKTPTINICEKNTKLLIVNSMTNLLGNPPKVIKTIWRTGEVWFTFLRNLKRMFLVWIRFITQQHWRFFFCFDFYNLFATIYSVSFPTSPYCQYGITPRPSDSQPLNSNVTPERQCPYLQLYHRPCFTIFLAFTIIWNYCIYLSVPAFIACLLPPCWDIHDCSSYSLLTVTLPTPPPHIPRRAHGQIGGAQ